MIKPRQCSQDQAPSMAALLLAVPFPIQSHVLQLSSRKTKISLSVAAAYELKEGQSRVFHRLPTGLRMEAIVQKPPPGVEGLGSPPPLVFIHGSFHAAWCWAEHWLPFFSGSGHHCFALSLLAQGESDVPEGSSSAGTLQMHVDNVADFIRKEVNLPPVLIGHSFGGLIVQSYLSRMENEGEDFLPLLAGAVLVCSVPPSGNSGLVWRYLFTKPIAAVKVTLSLAAKAFANSLPLCKETFFSSTMDDHQVLRYQRLMKDSSKLSLFDLKKLNASLPVPSIPKNSVKLLVMGASDDFIVDLEGLHETAKFYDVQPVCLEGVAHDVMLDSNWQKGAETITSWLKILS